MTNRSLLVMLVMVCFPTLTFSETVMSTVTGTNTISGTTTIDKAATTASAPSLIVNNTDVCKSGYSAGLQSNAIGLATGLTVSDKNCELLKLSRSLYSMGMKVAAVSTLCQDYRIFDAMIMAGTPCPYKGTIGKEALELWKQNEEDIPDGVSTIKKTKKVSISAPD